MSYLPPPSPKNAAYWKRQAMEMRSTLRAIYIWATFEDGRYLHPVDVEKLIDRTLKSCANSIKDV